jgi:hypothetical protein
MKWGHEKGTRKVKGPTPQFDAIQAQWLEEIERREAEKAQHKGAQDEAA